MKWGDPIKGADARLWEPHKPEPRCACGTVGYYSTDERIYCPLCWLVACRPGNPTERKGAA